MERYPGMNIMRGVLSGVLLLAAACGREPSVASRSAAAYREAQAKGIPVGGGHEHGGHAAATATATPMDHSAHGTTTGAAAHDHAGMNHDMTAGGAAMDHSAHGHAASPADHAAMGHGTSHGTAAVDHAAMGHGASHGTATVDHAAMGHGSHGMSHAATAGADPHAAHRAQQPAAAAQTDHSQHGAMQHGTSPAIPVIEAPRSSTEMRNLQPASTLQPDAFDAPAATSLSEAAKAGQPATDHKHHGNDR